METLLLIGPHPNQPSANLTPSYNWNVLRAEDVRERQVYGAL